MPKLTPTAQRTKGALIAYLGPRMAQDAALPKINPLLQDISARNFGVMIPTLARRVRTATRGKLAQDADLSDINELLEHLEGQREEEGESDDAVVEPEDVDELFPEAKDDGHELMARIKEHLADKLPPEELAKLDELMGEEEHLEEDEAWDRRADDARMRHGRDETSEEMEEREEREGAADARRRMGRDETPAECQDRRAKDKMSRDRRMGRDRKRAEDSRKKLGRDEMPEEAEDRRMRHRAADRKRAEDAMKRRADDKKRREADDRKRADDKRRRMAGDDPPPFEGRPEPGGTMTKDGVKRMVDDAVRHAKDEALATREAERFVRAWVGDFAPEMAMDSADQVYEQTLKSMNVPYEKGWPTAALKALVAAQPRPGQRTQQPPRLGMDAAGSGPSFFDLVPNAARVGLDG